MNTTFIPVNLKLDISTAAVKLARMRAGHFSYPAVWFGDISATDQGQPQTVAEKSLAAFKDFVKKVLKAAQERKERGYDPNPLEENYMFDPFVPDFLNNCPGCTVSGNGETIFVNRHCWDWYNSAVNTNRHWIEISKDGKVSAYETNNKLFPREILSETTPGTFRGWCVYNNCLYLSYEDGKLYTTHPSWVKEWLNPGTDSCSHEAILGVVQEFYAPEFIKGSELTGVSPTKKWWDKIVPAPDSLIVKGGGIDLIIPSSADSLIFGLGEYGKSRREFFFSRRKKKKEEEVKETQEWLKKYLFDPNKNFETFVKVIRDNGEEVLAKGIELLAKLCKEGTLDLKGTSVLELRQTFKDYPVFTRAFEEYSEMSIQIRKGFLKDNPAPEGVTVVDSIDTTTNRAKQSSKIVYLRDIMSPDDIINRGDVAPNSNFVFEFNGKEVSLREVDLRKGKTLAQLENGDFYYGSSETNWVNDTLKHRYAKDIESSKLDSIEAFCLSNYGEC